MAMVAAAASVAEGIGAKWLYYGNNMEEEATAYGDNDLDFIHYFNKVLQYGTLKGVQIKRALARLMKPEIIALGTALNVPYDLTWSCDEGFTVDGEFYNSNPRVNFVACGRCGCCTTRRHAFKRAGIPDPQNYKYELPDIYPWEGSKEYDLDKLAKLVC
jgi:7-cyano-7-deazaguanine synthase